MMRVATDIAQQIRSTPLVRYRGRVNGSAEIWLKDETRQITGAFKVRGNVAVAASYPKGKLLVTASTGNHGCGLAYAARRCGLQCVVFIPRGTPHRKKQRVLKNGGSLIPVDGDYDDCHVAAQEFASANDGHYISSFDDPVIVNGHRTMCEEIDATGIEFDAVVVPVGGGGLISACILHWGHLKRIVGVESDQGPAMKASLTSGDRVAVDVPAGFPEGLLVRRVGEYTFGICKKYVPEMRTVDSDSIRDAMRSLWINNRIKAEGAGAAALASTLMSPIYAKRVLCIVSGGNVDSKEFDKIVGRKI